MMERKYTGIQKILASAYLLLIFAALPIYMKDGFYLLADAKYIFYRGVSAAVLMLWVFFGAASVVRWWWDHRSCSMRKNWSQWVREHPGCSSTDCFVICFALASILSYLFSDYKDTAFTGYYGWYMGLLTQLFLVGGYFLVSRWYEKEEMVSSIIFLSASAVCLLGVMNRLGYDLLGTLKDMEDWSRRNLVSTIGNINWYCCYLTVIVPLLLYCFWAGKGWKRIPSGFAAFAGIAAILLQGSSSGYAALMTMYTVLMFGSLKDVRRFRRFLEAVLLVPLFYFLLWMIPAELVVPYEMEETVRMIDTPLWGILLGILAAGIVILQRVCIKKEKNCLEDGKVLKVVQVSAVTAVFAGILLLIGCQISEELWRFLGSPSLMRFDSEWGSRRGGLWAAAWKGFLKSDLIQKLCGAGPDCFARYFYEVESLEQTVPVAWSEGAIYANAHNEWLNMLINEGILGLAAYMGIFISALCRFWKQYGRNLSMMAGMMAAAAYLANQFFSFGQVVSTPLVFLVIAVCENKCRKIRDSGCIGKH